MRERLVLFSWQRHLQIPIFRFTLADLFLTACQDPHGTPWDPGAHSFCLGLFGAAVPLTWSSRVQRPHELPGNSKCQRLLLPSLGWKTSSDSSAAHKFQHVVRHVTIRMLQSSW